MKNAIKKFILFLFLFVPIFSSPPELSGYRHAYLPPPTSDTWGLYGVLYDSIRESGLDAFSNLSGIPEEERLRTCVITMTTWGDLTQYARIRVSDMATNALIKETSEWARMHMGIRACAIAAVQQAWKAVKYQGYNEASFQNNMGLLFPSRPTVSITAEKIREMSPLGPLEGIWSDTENKYTIGIIKDTTSIHADYVGVVLKSSTPAWKPGEIKMELNEAAGNTYTGNAYMLNKSKVGASFTLENSSTLLKFDVPAGNNTTTRIVYVKNFPKVSSPSGTTGPQSNTPPQKSWTGSGFLISEGGLVATNFHVAGTATTLKLTFPKIGKEFTGKLLLKDPNNDLAIIKIDNFSLADISQTSIPYGYKKTKAVSMGDQIFTIGYPLSPLLGQNPKFTNGTISSKSGMGDDMVHLQINAAIQPGNSGSPLFDENGNIVGIIVASLNAEWMRGRFGSIPQNVNFAIKSEYLFNLAEMLPVTIKMNEVAQKISPEAIAPFVCLISAQ